MSVADQQRLRQLLLAALGKVPEAGAILSALTGFLWNPTTNIWDEIKAEVEALIEEDLAKYDETEVQGDLDGLKKVIDDYQQQIADGNLTTVATDWQICKDLFDQQLPHFQRDDYKLQLLLLFVQYANLYFALLVDGVRFGPSWGWNSAQVATALTTLTNDVATFRQYVDDVVTTAVQAKQAATPSNKHTVDPFATVNAYSRLLEFNATDVARMWPYFLPGSVPSNPPFYRQVCSDPVGSSDDAGADVVMRPFPAMPITGVRIWADASAVYAAQLQFQGSVLRPVDGYTDRGAADLPPYGGSFAVSDGNPIVAVLVAAGDHIQGVQFQFKDGTTSQAFGNCNGAAPLDNYGEMVSDFYIASSSVFYNLSAACLIVGYVPCPV